MGAAAIFLEYKQKFYHSGSGIHFQEEDMKQATLREEPLIDASRSLCFVALRMGTRPIGSLAISGQMLSKQTLEALSGLIAVAFERARTIEELGKTEASREGERLKSALLDSVTHDFRTPLTSIKAAVTSLLSVPPEKDPAQQELLTVINEECDRLNQLVGDAAEMARLDAGEFELKLEPNDIGKIVAAALQHCKNTLGARPMNIEIPIRRSAGARGLFPNQRRIGAADRECQWLLTRRPARHHQRRGDGKSADHRRGGSRTGH